jgi:hypothetical protein
MSGWSDWIFGNLPPQPQPAHPSSRGSLFGMKGSSIGAGYQNLPDTRRIVDRRQEPTDQAYWMTYFQAPPDEAASYPPSLGGGSAAPGGGGLPFDPTRTVAPLVAGLNDDGSGAGYKPSFQPTYRPPYTRQAPYRAWPTGPNLPLPGYNPNSDLAPIGPHLPISPGDPGWTPPPSPSGPHNPQGDPARPGYDIAIMDPTTLASALRQWGGWQ